MEEWIGAQWHRFVTRRAEGTGARHEVRLAERQRGVLLLLHAGGGRLRLGTAAPLCVARADRPPGLQGWWQRLAGSGLRVPLAQVDGEVLALPERLHVFDDPALNADLYLWWAALASSLDPRQPWLAANVAGTAVALARFPGLRPRWQRLCEAELVRRSHLQPRAPAAAAAAAAEAAVRAALRAAWRGDALAEPTELAAVGFDEVAPVWPWLVPMAAGDAAAAAGTGEACRPPGEAPAQLLQGRRRARRRPTEKPRAPLLLAAKGESLATFADPMSINRAHDDDDDGSAAVAAEELERLTLEDGGGSVAARVRFDLDLPSASADDLLLSEGERLPEWDLKRAALVDDRVVVQSFVARPADGVAWQPTPALRATAAQVRRRMDLQRAAPRWQRAATDGEAIDLDAWVRVRGDGPGRGTGGRGDLGQGPGPDPIFGAPLADTRTRTGGSVGTATGRPGTAADAIYQRRVRGQRELATLLLADLSLSTDAHVNDRQRIIDVIRDALYVFGEAHSASGDAFAVHGFSSVKRRLRLHLLKGFDERWGAPSLARLGALKPGYYTRMGAALRAGTRRLQERPERQRLLLLLTDGKPHDIDGYEGRLGVEDTRQAVLEARRAGVLPFALSIDSEAGEVLPHLFGHKGWAWVRRPAELPQRLAALVAQLQR